MNENLKKLEKWYDSISGFEKLKFPEVKTLLNVMNVVTDVNVKKEIREKIITGTLHVIYAFIKSNEIFLVPNMNYDIDDVINTFVEFWINAIDSGELVNVNSYSQLLYRSIGKIANALVGEQNNKEHIFLDDFLLLLDYFLKEEPNYEVFLAFVNEKGLKVTPSPSREYEILELYLLLSDLSKNVFSFLNKDEISNTKKRFLKDFLISFRTYTLLKFQDVDYDIEKRITNNLYCEQILERMKNGKQFPINNFERFSAIFNFRFQENMTFEEIAQELGISQKNVRSIYELALERARYFVKVLK